MKKSFSVFLLILGLFLFVSMLLTKVNTVNAGAANLHKVDICHSNEGINGWTANNVDADSIDGVNSGNSDSDHNRDDHRGGKDIIPPFYDDEARTPGYWSSRNWDATGQAIWSNSCNIPEPTPTDVPEPTPTDVPEPTPTDVPEPTPTDIPEPTPTEDPGQDPTPTPTDVPQDGKTSVLGYDISCNKGDFVATFDLKENGVATANVVVSFTYNGLTKQDTTNQDGRARVTFPQQGSYDLKATPENGYQAQTMKVNMPENCAAGEPTVTPSVGGLVLGVSTESTGQVLGVSTMANTGMAEDLMALSSIASGILLLGHAQKKKN